MLDDHGGQEGRETEALGGEQSMLHGLHQLRAYGRKIAGLYHNRREDTEDVLQDAALKLIRWRTNGRRLRTQKDLKSLYRQAVKNASIDLLRKKFGRADKDGQIKRPRRQVELESSAFDSTAGNASPSPEALRAELKEWAEVIRREAGNGAAFVFKRKCSGWSDREIANDLGLDLRTVLSRVNVARAIVNRYRRQKLGWSA